MLDSKSQIFNNFLPSATITKLHQFVNAVNWTYGWKSHTNLGFAHWNYDVCKSEIRNGLDVSELLPDPVNEAWQYIKSNVLPDYKLIRCYANGHTHGVEGYPHTDSNREQDITVVIYMNQTWKREWGGETVIYAGDDIIMSAVPVFNRALIFNGNQYHCARPVGRLCPDLRKTIMFKCARNDADPTRDKLQTFLNEIGATSKRHKNGSLTNHLLGTYDLLKMVNQPSATCLAGGAHSVLGTNIFTDACLSTSETHRLIDAIGADAVELIQLFGSTKRPDTFENALLNNSTTLELIDGGSVTVSSRELYALCVIEAANLHDQDASFSKFPELKKIWSDLRSISKE